VGQRKRSAFRAVVSGRHNLLLMLDRQSRPTEGTHTVPHQKGRFRGHFLTVQVQEGGGLKSASAKLVAIVTKAASERGRKVLQNQKVQY